MDKTVVGEENVYFEMESEEATGAGIYDDVACDSAAHATKQTIFQKQKPEKKRQALTQRAHSTKSDAVIVQRLLYIIAAVVTVSFLTAAATLILALTMMISRNVQTASTDCSALKGGDTSTPSADYTELSKNVQDLKHNVSSLKQTLFRADLEEIRKKYEELKSKVINISKTQGQRGPPGYNGTQGPPGVSGSRGPSGPAGSCNMSLCSYKRLQSVGQSPSVYADQQITVTETNGKKILGANCETNDAQFVSLTSTIASDGKRTYKCTCTDTITSGQSTIYCIIHYWECPT